MISRSLACFVAAAFVAVAFSFSSATADDFGLVLHANARLVEISVVAQTRDGQPATGLTKRDFEVLDDGKPQEIRLFSAETNAAGKVAEP